MPILQNCLPLFSNTTYTLHIRLSFRVFVDGKCTIGEIWSIQEKKSGNLYVLKLASKHLHDKKVSRLDNESVICHEDIVKEASLMKHLCSFQSCPPSIIRYHGFFESDKNYYLILQHGGSPLFDFVVRAHRLLALNKLDITDWIPVVRAIFQQLIDAMAFLHAQRVCHMDISLENMTISNHINIVIENQGSQHEKVKFVDLVQDVQIKLIDFGVAETFAFNQEQKSSDSDFRCDKFCGKRNYQSPEIIKREVFDAAANDIWCAGICLFMMVAGSGPFDVADSSDAAYNFVMNGHLKPLLQHWGKLAYFDASLLHLFSVIFQPESQRVSLSAIQKHPWLHPSATKKS